MKRALSAHGVNSANQIQGKLDEYKIVGICSKSQSGFNSNSRSLFLYFRLFNTVDSKQNVLHKSLPMTGFELQISPVASDRFTN